MNPRRPRRGASALLGLALALGACAPAPALRSAAPASAPGVPAAGDLSIRVEERFYTVAGTTPWALNRSLADGGPRKEGRAAHALTQWRVAWSYVPEPRASGCTSGRPAVSVEIVTTLPRWVDGEAASERLVRDWSLFLGRLREHETVHQDIAVGSGRRLLETLSALEAATCAELAARARAAVERLASSSEASQGRFDRESDYGMRSPGR